MAKKFPKRVPDFPLKPRHVKLLKFARMRLEEKLNNCICPAIGFGAHNSDQSGLKCGHEKALTASVELKQFILRAIERNTYFHYWQTSQGMQRSGKQQRRDRIDWIDYILKNAPRA